MIFSESLKIGICPLVLWLNRGIADDYKTAILEKMFIHLKGMGYHLSQGLKVKLSQQFGNMRTYCDLTQAI